MKPGFAKGKPIEGQRDALISEYRVLAHWYRTHGETDLAKHCEEVADQAAQMNLFEKQALKARRDAKKNDRAKQTTLF